MIYKLYHNTTIFKTEKITVPSRDVMSNLTHNLFFENDSEYPTTRMITDLILKTGWYKISSSEYDIYFINVNTCICLGLDELSVGGFISVCLKHIKQYNREEKLSSETHLTVGKIYENLDKPSEIKNVLQNVKYLKVINGSINYFNIKEICRFIQ